jgi:hypothetical protein
MFNKKKGENKMYIHQNAFLGLDKIVKMLKSKKVNKKNKIHFTMKDAGDLSPMAVNILLQLDLDTVRDGKYGKNFKERA